MSAARRPLPTNHQPAQQYLKDQRWTVRLAAEAIDVPKNHLWNCLMGRTPPSRAVRERLPALLGGIPLDRLFDADLLAREYSFAEPKTYNVKPTAVA